MFISLSCFDVKHSLASSTNRAKKCSVEGRKKNLLPAQRTVAEKHGVIFTTVWAALLLRGGEGRVGELSAPILAMTGSKGLGAPLLLPFRRFALQLCGRDERQVCLSVRNGDVEERKKRKRK